MMAVMIGIDPHKGSHTAVAIGAAEEPLGELRVRASAAQACTLVAWAAPWPKRTWAVEGAGGLGHLLAQQLVAAGERVLDVPPKLASRVRLLQAGDTNKNDPNDALSVAVAALRSKARRQVLAEDHAAVLKVWAKRHRDLARSRNQVACRFTRCYASSALAASVRRSPQLTLPAFWTGHAVRPGRGGAPRAGPPVPGGPARPGCPAPRDQEEAGRGRQGLGTSLTEVFGFGPVNTGTVIGDVTDVTRFPSRDHFASYNGTAPVEVSSGNRKIYRLSLRGNRRINHALHMAAITQIRHAHSDGRAYYERKIAEGKTHKEALRCLKRRISDAVFPASRPTPGRPQPRQRRRAREGNRGTTLTPARPATPRAPALRTSHSRAQPQPYDPPPRPPGPPHRNPHQRKPDVTLDTNSKEGDCNFNGVTPEMEETPVTDVTASQDQGRAELPAADEQLLRELTERARSGGLRLTGEGGLLGRLTKMVVEGALEGELDDHLGYGMTQRAAMAGIPAMATGPRRCLLIPGWWKSACRATGSRLSSRGSSPKGSGAVRVDEMVISLSAKGLTHGEIAAHLAEVYGAEVSNRRSPRSPTG